MESADVAFASAPRSNSAPNTAIYSDFTMASPAGRTMARVLQALSPFGAAPASSRRRQTPAAPAAAAGSSEGGPAAAGASSSASSSSESLATAAWHSPPPTLSATPTQGELTRCVAALQDTVARQEVDILVRRRQLEAHHSALRAARRAVGLDDDGVAPAQDTVSSVPPVPPHVKAFAAVMGSITAAARNSGITAVRLAGNTIEVLRRRYGLRFPLATVAAVALIVIFVVVPRLRRALFLGAAARASR